MTGFFDLSGSVNLLFGIVSGMLLASATDTMILAGIITGASQHSYSRIIRSVDCNSRVSFRPVPTGKAEKRSTQGISSVRMDSGPGNRGDASISPCVQTLMKTSTPHTRVSMYSILIALLISITACTGHAVLSTYQGAMILEPRRLAPFFSTSILRAGRILSLILSIYTPVILIAPLTAEGRVGAIPAEMACSA